MNKELQSTIDSLRAAADVLEAAGKAEAMLSAQQKQIAEMERCWSEVTKERDDARELLKHSEERRTCVDRAADEHYARAQRAEHVLLGKQNEIDSLNRRLDHETERHNRDRLEQESVIASLRHQFVTKRGISAAAHCRIRALTTALRDMVRVVGKISCAAAPGENLYDVWKAAKDALGE